MTDDRLMTDRTLRSIAAALGIEPEYFFAEHRTPHGAQETLELVSAFDGIADPVDRRACLDFVRVIAERQGI